MPQNAEGAVPFTGNPPTTNHAPGGKYAFQGEPPSPMPNVGVEQTIDRSTGPQWKDYPLGHTMTEDEAVLS